LAAIEIMKLKQILILQNKIDLIKESQAKEQYEEITKFVQGTVAEGAPIIPISAQLKYNIDVLCEYIVNKIPVPPRDFNAPPRLIVIRSFDVNKPGCEVADLKGGVAGGSILSGVLKVGQEIEVRPGVVTKDSDGNITCRPIFSRIVSLFAEQNELQYAVPGGLIGVGTKIDPTLCRTNAQCFRKSTNRNIEFVGLTMRPTSWFSKKALWMDAVPKPQRIRTQQLVGLTIRMKLS